MNDKIVNDTVILFPKIQDDILERLSKEAHDRTQLRKFSMSAKLHGKRRWLRSVNVFRYQNKNAPVQPQMLTT